MSQGSIVFEQGNSAAEFPTTTPVKLACIKDADYINKQVAVLAYVGGDPATYAATEGDFAAGCIIIDTANGTAYTNAGTLSTPSWTVIS